MTSDPIADRLRAASEDDVLRAIEGSYVEEALEGVAPDVLLEFFQRMLDAVLGEEET